MNEKASPTASDKTDGLHVRVNGIRGTGSASGPEQEDDDKRGGHLRIGHMALIGSEGDSEREDDDK
ncbi:hypothetical protein [Leifsonia virtsii]|uniref:Uncharacterized protein n=1 Tax=Leifsonia virtsii TaxID=3035915 RepID=A0ABT8IT63_9MICO|nr:hypothetical protein [Leifsonia virtsii]MDN4595903.1 hypothetical protein [Leifsonia virtsii]